MADDTVMKERAILFIDRRIGELETAKVDHEKMAEAAVPYTDRQRVEAEAAERTTQNQTELEALQWARDKLKEM
jgi:hypothetical protein